MRNLSQPAIEAFNIRAIKIEKAKGKYRCFEADRIVLIGKSYDREASLHFQLDIKMGLESVGYPVMDPFLIAYHKPFYSVYKDLFVAVEEKDRDSAFENIDLRSVSDIKALLEGLAYFHIKGAQLAKKIEGQPAKLTIFDAQRDQENWKSYHKMIISKSRMLDIDIHFIKWFTDITMFSTSWIHRETENKLIKKLISRPMALCHQRLKEKHMSYNKKTGYLYLKDFSYTVVNHPVYDISDCIYLLSLQNNHDIPMSFGEMMDIYTQINPLEEEEILALKEIIQYPSELFQMYELYFSKKRNFVPRHLEEKIMNALTYYIYMHQFLHTS